MWKDQANKGPGGKKQEVIMGTVVMGLFDEQQQAVRAQAALQAIGIPMNQIW